MPALFHKNAILTGYLDHYCLACEAHLKGEDDITGHIAKPVHKKNLDAAAYVEKFADDCIRKVKKGYYCEFCNIMLSTAAKVNLHVADPKHYSSKGSFLLRRSGSAVIAFQDVLIDEKAWHGLIEDTCATCNTEFDNEQIHKTESSHILNLVQCKVEFGAGKAVYRKVDDSSFQCLTCNHVLALSDLESHFNQADHKDLINIIEDKNGKETAAIDANPINVGMQETKAIQKVQNDQTEAKSESKKSASFELKFHFGDTPKKKTADIKTESVETSKKKTTDVKTESVETPKKKTADMKPGSAEPTNKKVTKEVKKTETVKIETCAAKKQPVGPIKLEPGTKDLDEEICKVLDAKNYIVHDENGKKWCLLCDWTMDGGVIENHIQGRHHQIMLKMHNERIAEKRDAAVVTEIVNKDKEVKKMVVIERASDIMSKTNILDNKARFASSGINVDFESTTAMCKKCSINIDFNYDAIENHIEEHKKVNITVKNEASVKKEVTNESKTKTTLTNLNELKKANAAPKPNENESKKQKKSTKAENDNNSERSNSVASRDADEDIEKYAKANELIHGRGGATVYCRKCDTKIPFALKNMKEHVAGLSHKKRAAMIVTQKPTIKIRTEDFVKNFVGVERDFVKDVIINEKFCINFFSFCFLSNSRGEVWCQLCDVRCRSFEEMGYHTDQPLHQRAMGDVLVVSSYDTEFLREIRPGKLHCGYCNSVIDAEDLQNHLLTTLHREAKTHARWRLQQCMPEIVRHHRNQEYELRFLLAMLMHENPFSD